METMCGHDGRDAATMTTMARQHYGGGWYGDEIRAQHVCSAAPAARQQTYRLLCKAGEDSLAARDGKVCDSSAPTRTTTPSTRVKDEDGYPAIPLVNKATGEELKHFLRQSHPVISL